MRDGRQGQPRRFTWHHARNRVAVAQSCCRRERNGADCSPAARKRQVALADLGLPAEHSHQRQTSSAASNSAGSPVPHKRQLPMVFGGPPRQPQAAGRKDEEQQDGHRCGGKATVVSTAVSTARKAPRSVTWRLPALLCNSSSIAATQMSPAHTLLPGSLHPPAPAIWVWGVAHCRSATLVLQPVILLNTSWCTRCSCTAGGQQPCRVAQTVQQWAEHTFALNYRTIKPECTPCSCAQGSSMR